jgi:prepilin-type N-terminal cleavage/methylation domain-containing protein
MYNTHCNNKGLTLIEVLITLVIVAIGLVSTLAVFPQGAKLSVKSDYTSRAAALLREELETNEMLIMNCCNALPSGGTRTVRSSGESTQQSGDVSYTVTTTITDIGNNQWRVTVLVSWATNSISDSMVVGLQAPFCYPAGCSCVRGSGSCPS